MDMVPPQPPAALVQSVGQEAIDAIARLAEAQQWLDTQQKQLPDWPDGDPATLRGAYLDQLDAYWRTPVPPAPGASAVPRIDALSLRIAGIARDDATLRVFDGTLDPRAEALVRTLTAGTGDALPATMKVREVLLGDTPYAGAFVVQDDLENDLVLLFFPDRGWEAFSSLDLLHAQVEGRLRRRLVHQVALPGMHADDSERAVVGKRMVSSRVVEGSPFTVLAQRIASVQREKLADAWRPLPRAGSSSPSLPADRARLALDLHAKLDVQAMLVEREIRLRERLDAQRLEDLPDDVAASWRESLASYRSEGIATWRQATPIPRLVDYARQSLRPRLQALGVALEPDDIVVRARGKLQPTTLADAVSRDQVDTVPLTALALHNVGWFDLRTFQAQDAAGDAVGALDGATLRALVRDLNLLDRYQAAVRLARDRAKASDTRWLRARMRFEANDARLGYYLPDEPPSFRPDHAERGYRWIQALVDAPVASVRQRVEGHDIVASQLTLQGVPVSGVLVVGVRDPGSVPTVLMYTPDAPDGRTFREFDDRAAAARDFLYRPEFQDYLLDRLPAAFAETLDNGQRRFKVAASARTAHWALGSGSNGRTLTPEPFAEKPIDGDLFGMLHDTESARMLRDVTDLGRTTSAADRQSIGRLLGLPGQSFAAGRLVVDMAGAPARALQASWRFYDSAKAGNHAQAFVDFTQAYTSVLELPAPRGLASLRPSLAWRSGSARHLAPATRKPWTDPRQLFDSRFAAKNVDLSRVQPDDRGLFRVGPSRFIRQHDVTYAVRYDERMATWRLTRPHALDATFTGPAIELGADGLWRLRTDLGLRGGRHPEAPPPHQPSLPLDTVDGRDLDVLRGAQTEAFEQLLADSLGSRTQAARLRTRASLEPGPLTVTPAEWTAWLDAMEGARMIDPGDISVMLPISLPAPGWRILEPHEWPAAVWFYPDRPVGTGPVHGALRIESERVAGSGTIGLPTVTQSPDEWARSIPGAPGNLPAQRAQEWIRINLAAIREHAGVTNPVLWIRVIRGPDDIYIVQSTLDRFPDLMFGTDEHATGVQPLP